MPGNRFAGAPITDDDATIAAALEDLSIPTLMLSMVHMTGDPSLHPRRPATGGDLPQRGAGVHERPRTRPRCGAEALDVIRAYRDGGCVLPPPPDPELLHEMMDFLVAGQVPDEYVPLLLEELELDGDDARDVELGRRRPRRAKADFHVVVIGAGMSGAAGRHPARARRDPVHHRREERRASAARGSRTATPGAGSTSATTSTRTRSRPTTSWTEFFARQPELQAYFERCMVELRRRRPHPLRDRGRRRPDGTTTTARWHGRRSRDRDRRGRRDHRGQRGDQRRRPAQPTEAARHRRAATRSPGVAMHSAQWVRRHRPRRASGWR